MTALAQEPPLAEETPSKNEAQVVSADEQAVVEAKPQKAWGGIVVCAGLAALTAITVAAIIKYDTASDAASVVTVSAGVIAAIVGAYFGIRGATLAAANAKIPPPPGTAKTKRTPRHTNN